MVTVVLYHHLLINRRILSTLIRAVIFNAYLDNLPLEPLIDKFNASELDQAEIQSIKSRTVDKCRA